MVLIGKTLVLGTTTALTALLAFAAISAVDAVESEGLPPSSSSGTSAKLRKKKKADRLFDAEGKGKGQRKGRRGGNKRRGKGGSRRRSKGKGGSGHAMPPMPPADGCPCFDATDIDEYWYMYKSHYTGEDPCDAVEYEKDGKEWFIVFTGNEDAEEGFEFYVEDDDDVGVCEVSKYFDPSVGHAKVDRSFAGMDFEDMDMVEHCVDEIKHSSMYKMCIE